MEAGKGDARSTEDVSLLTWSPCQDLCVLKIGPSNQIHLVPSTGPVSYLLNFCFFIIINATRSKLLQTMLSATTKLRNKKFRQVIILEKPSCQS